MKQRLLTIIFIFFCIQTVTITADIPSNLPTTPIAAHMNARNNQAVLAILKSVLCIMIGEIIQLSADDRSKQLLDKQLQFKNILISIASNYGSRFFVTLCHELGHACVAKLLNGSPIDVHLGANSGSDGSIISLGGISLDGFDPRIGYCNYQAPCENKTEINEIIEQALQKNNENSNNAPSVIRDNIQQKKLEEFIAQLRHSPEFQALKKNIVKINPFKRAAILLAGGIGGILGRFATKTASHLIFNAPAIHQENYKDVLKQAMSQACTLDHIYLNQCINMFIPFNTGSGGSDASKLWEECIGIHPSAIKALETIAPLFEIAGEQYLARYEATNPHATAQTKALIGLLNYLDNGTVRLHV